MQISSSLLLCQRLGHEEPTLTTPHQHVWNGILRRGCKSSWLLIFIPRGISRPFKNEMRSLAVGAVIPLAPDYQGSGDNIMRLTLKYTEVLILRIC